MLRKTLCCLFVVLGMTPLARAEEPVLVDPRVAAVAPYVNDKTFMVLHLNLRKLDLKTATDRFAALAPADAADQVGQAKAVVKIVEFARQNLIDSGAGDLYVIADGGEEPGAQPMAYLVVPVETGNDPQKVIATLSSMPGVDQDPFVHKGNVLYGDPETKTYVDAIQPGDTTRFKNAFKFAGQTDIQVAIAPTPAMIEQAQANVPAGGDEAQQELAQAMRGFVLTANLPPKPALAFFLLMKDDASAKQVNDMLQEFLQSEQGQQIKAHPLGAKMVELLTPTLDGDKLRLVMTEQNGGIAKLTEGLKEGVALAKDALENGALALPGGFGPPGGAPEGFPPPEGTPIPGATPPSDNPFK